jgi:parvulin-like peptidyl-prolyl isomerase
LPKKKYNQPEREVTRRQISHWQRESRIQRFTLIGGIVIIVAVLIIVGVGVFTSKIAPGRAVVIKAGEAEFTQSYFNDALSIYGRQMYSYYQQMGLASSTSYSQVLSNITDSVVATIQRNAVVKAAAAQLDPPVTVSDDEIEKSVSGNSSANVPELNQATKDAIYADLLDGKLQSYFDTKIPQTAEQRAVLAMFMESESQAEDVKAQIAGGADFRNLAKELSLESNSKSKDGDFGFVPEGVLSTTLGNRSDTVLDDLVFSSNTTANSLVSAEDKDQSKSIGYWVLKVVEYQTATTPTATEATPTTSSNATEVKIHVMAMLLGSKDQADQMKAELDNGADFATLAKANSQYTNATMDGGDLSFIAKGKLGTAADAVLFPDDTTKALTAGTITDPIADTSQTTKGGFWLAEVTAIDPNKTIEGDNRTTLANNLKSDWETEKTSDTSQNANLLTPDQISKAQADALARGY